MSMVPPGRRVPADAAPPNLTDPVPPAHDMVLVEFLLGFDGLLDAMHGQHVDDGTGHCRGCPDARNGRPVYPCRLRPAIDRARQVHADRAAAGC